MNTSHRKTRRHMLSLTALLALSLLLGACGAKPNSTNGGASTPAASEPASTTAPTATPVVSEPVIEEKDYHNETNPVVTLALSNGDQMEIELYPELAPNTVNNFISLVNSGFYDGLIFHRVIPGFMIQGGDPLGNGKGGPGYNIAGEFSKNKFDNDLLHKRGVISMARAEDPNSAGSQFFLMVDTAPHLDNLYAGFGKIVNGIEAIDTIVAQERDKNDMPVENPIAITKATVDTKGISYDEPTKVE